MVTGITGQDGGYLAERLVREGVLVHGITRTGESPPLHLVDLGDRVIIHPLDLTDPVPVTDLVLDIAPHEIYHLAGMSSVALSWEQPVTTVAVNTLSAATILTAAWKLQEQGTAPSVLLASSAEIFAGANSSPQDEATPLSPRSPYGAAKAAAHLLVHVYRHRGLHAVNAVLYNHESPRRPRQFVTRKITSTVAAIARGEASELVLGNLDVRRDWGWAPDYVDAMVMACRHPVPLDVVVATGKAHSVQEFVAAAFSAAGIDQWRHLVRTDERFSRPGEAVELVGNPRLAREELGWAPTIGFEEIVARMVAHDLHPQGG